MATARERVQALDAQLRELEKRFGGNFQPTLPPLPDLPSSSAQAAQAPIQASITSAHPGASAPYVLGQTSALAVRSEHPVTLPASRYEDAYPGTGGSGRPGTDADLPGPGVACQPFQPSPDTNIGNIPAAHGAAGAPETAMPATQPVAPTRIAGGPHAAPRRADASALQSGAVSQAMPSQYAAVPLRLYRQGLPHRDLGPPQSVWEADKNAAVVALADRVQQLEHELQHQQQQQQQQQQQGAAHGVPDGPVAAAQAAVMPPPPVDLLPVPRTILGTTSHANVAAFDGIYAGGKPPLPVKYFPPPPPGQPLSAEAALVRVPAAQGPRGQARAFAASVAASAAATVPSVMMKQQRRKQEAASPVGDNGGEEDDNDGNDENSGGGEGARPSVGGGRRGNGTSSVGVSAPLGYSSAAARAAASVQVAALREAGPLQPAEQYPMVAAALATGTPGTGGSTWEQGKMRALISLEQQRDQLRAQLESYKGLEERHRRQMLDLRESHRKELITAAGIAGSKLNRLLRSAGWTYARRLLALRVSRALHAWRHITLRNRRLKWAAAVWRQRELSAVFGDWHMLTLTNRHERQTRKRAATRYLRTVLMAWSAAAQEIQRLRRLERRALQARRRRLLLAWAQRTAELQSSRMRLYGAARHCAGALLRRGWRGLAAEVARGRAAEAALRQRLSRAALRGAFRTWVACARLGKRLDAMHRRAVLRSVLRAWAAFTARISTRCRKVAGFLLVRRKRRLSAVLAAWAVEAQRLAKLATASLALQTAVSRYLLAEGLTCLRLAPRERAWARRRGIVALRAWKALAQRAARNRRIVALRGAARSRATLSAVYDAWRVLAKARSVQLHLREIHRLQELEPTYEHQMELVRQDRAAVQSHVRAVMAELNLLRAELLRGFVMSAEGGLLGKPLRWRSLPPDPGQWLPPARSRHSTLFLRALQLPAAAPPRAATQRLPLHSTLRASVVGSLGAAGTGALGEGDGGREAGGGSSSPGRWIGTLQAGSPGAHGSHHGLGQRTGTTGHVHHAEDVEAVVPDVAGVLVVFGGINEEEWFRDVHVLEVSYTEGANAKFHWHQVEVEAEPEPEAGVEAGTLRAAWPQAATGTATAVGTGTDGRLPVLTRRDHAACVTSPNQFVVVGGFDGTAELMDIQAVTVRAAEDSVGWAASVRTVVPRNRTPPGRSHHTVAAHPSGRSLYVFGGYASSRGALSELWAFHLDHHEWWQPNTTGDQPPPRRNHVAAMVAGRLYIHGGFNGTECLGDTWVLDPQTWHWEKLKTAGTPPSPRRGHAADVVDDRYLVVHGGYDGAGYLADGAVLDTATATWRDLAAAGGPEDMPTARAHHTLTLVGHVMVALGGSGPMGPLLDMHLLESPPLVAGLAQQYRVMAVAAQLSATQAGMADTEAALAVTRNRAEMAEQQLHVLRERSSDVLARHNAALADIDRLKTRLAAESVRVVAAEAATAQAQLALATAERRLRRTREGGNEVAAAARDMHDTVCDLREEVARLRGQLLSTSQQHNRDASQLAATVAERQLLQQQLAGAQQEAALLRGMLATAEAEFRAALERQKGAAEAELAAATERAKQMAVAAAKAAGGAAAAGTAAEMDLVALHQLATATARAETAEIRLHAMEREYGGLKADLANVNRQLQQQRQARDAAEERAAAAMQHMHASELRYQMQIEDLQRQLLEAQRARWREDLGIGATMPPRKRTAPQAPEDTAAPQAPAQAPPQAPEDDPEDAEQAAARAEAEELLRNARPPPDGEGLPAPERRSVAVASASAVRGAADPRPHFTVQHVEQLLVEDPALEVLPEVARLLQLQRRVLGSE